jgi:hypothetical protein
MKHLPLPKLNKFLQILDQLYCVYISAVVKTVFFSKGLFKLLISKFVYNLQAVLMAKIFGDSIYITIMFDSQCVYFPPTIQNEEVVFTLSTILAGYALK